jgi:hypothetical protein
MGGMDFTTGNATDLYLLTVSPWDDKGISEEAYYAAQRELAALELEEVLP